MGVFAALDYTSRCTVASVRCVSDMGPNREIVDPGFDAVIHSSDYRAIPVLPYTQCLGDAGASFGRSSGGFDNLETVATSLVTCRWRRWE
jgi:hypothetical protein